MKYESMIQNRQWDALSRALQTAEGFIGTYGGRYICDAYDVHLDVDNGSHDLNALERRLFDVLHTSKEKFGEEEIQSVRKVIHQFESIQQTLDHKLQEAPLFAFYATRYRDFQNRFHPLIFPFGIETISVGFECYVHFRAKSWQRVPSICFKTAKENVKDYRVGG